MNEFIDHLELVKAILFWLYLVATIGVVVGVYWEGDQFEKSKKLRGRRLLLVSLGAEIFFSGVIFCIDGRISRIQLSKIAVLESRLAARTLSPRDATELSARLNRFTGQVFELHSYPDDQESVDIGDQLSTVLVSAGWSARQSANPFAVVGAVAAIAVHRHDNASQSVKDATQELVTALNDKHIAAKLRPSFDAGPADLINVIVGIKP